MKSLRQFKRENTVFATENPRIFAFNVYMPGAWGVRVWGSIGGIETKEQAIRYVYNRLNSER